MEKTAVKANTDCIMCGPPAKEACRWCRLQPLLVSTGFELDDELRVVRKLFPRRRSRRGSRVRSVDFDARRARPRGPRRPLCRQERVVRDQCIGAVLLRYHALHALTSWLLPDAALFLGALGQSRRLRYGALRRRGIREDEAHLIGSGEKAPRQPHVLIGGCRC